VADVHEHSRPLTMEFLKRETLELTLQTFGCACRMGHVAGQGSMQMLKWFVDNNPARRFTEWAAKWYCPASHRKTIEVPKNWLEHLKEAHAPDWVKKRWPVKYEVYKVYEMFPEYAWPMHGGHKRAISILTNDACREGPRVLQHPPLGEIWGCLISATCIKCYKDIYCYAQNDDIGTPGDRISSAVYAGIQAHLISGECKS